VNSLNAVKARAFNEGCDARLDGRNLTDNPHREHGPTVRSAMHDYWRQGWLDVHHHFGRAVHGRWAFRRPPNLRMAIA
jgi:hypothetical protein